MGRFKFVLCLWVIDETPMKTVDERSKDNETIVVLLTTGGMNPPHLMHRRLLEAAKEYVETTMGLQVAGGFLSPSHDGYVCGKLGREAIPRKYRLAMCQALVSDSDWIEADGWEVAQPSFVDYPSVVRRMQRMLRAHYPKNTIRVIYVCGADHLMRCSFLGMNDGVIGVGRGDYTPRQVQQRLTEHMHFVEKPLGDVSSTKIRALMKRGEDVEELVGKNVVAYIRQDVNGWVTQFRKG